MATHITRDVLSERGRLRLSKAFYLILGTTIIGYVLWMAQWRILQVTGITKPIGNLFVSGPSVTVTFVACYVIGAFIGNWIGKRRNYHLPQWPT